MLDSVTGQLLEWECGDRGARTLKKLYGRIRHWNVQYYCTDEWEAYAKILPKEKLVMSKALTIGIEQNNGRQRHPPSPRGSRRASAGAAGRRDRLVQTLWPQIHCRIQIQGDG